jgi:hypothetical protein
MTDVFAVTTVRQCCTGQIGQSDSVIEFAVGEQSSVGRDAAAVELKLQAPVEIDPQSVVI